MAIRDPLYRVQTFFDSLDIFSDVFLRKVIFLLTSFRCGCTFDLRDQVSHITNEADLFPSHLNIFGGFSTSPNFSKFCDPNLTQVQILDGNFQQKWDLFSNSKNAFVTQIGVLSVYF